MIFDSDNLNFRKLTHFKDINMTNNFRYNFLQQVRYVARFSSATKFTYRYLI